MMINDERAGNWLLLTGSMWGCGWKFSLEATVYYTTQSNDEGSGIIMWSVVMFCCGWSYKPHCLTPM